MYPNDIPLADEDVGFEVLLGNPRMNPTDIHVYADYYIGTNRWGVANWAVTEAGTNIYESTELVQDANNPYLYRSSIGDMVPGKPVDTVVQYRIRVTYTGTFASPVTSAAFDYPEWYEPVDLNVDYADQGFSPYYWVFSCPTGCVFINEFYPSGGSSYHNSEYIEIIGPAKASIGGWKIDLVDGDTVSREEDYVTATYDLPADARFIAPAESTHGWGFYVAGDTECIESNKVNYVFADHAAQNLLTPGGIRIRRSMGAYVDRVSWGSTGRPAGNEMPKRGYRYAGTRGTYGSALRRSFALLVESSEEQGDYLAFALADIGVTTLGEMNTLSAAELWGDCPYSFAEAFTDASVEALNEYFDKYTSSSDYADLLYELTLNDATELLALSIDEATLTPDTDFTIEALGDNALTITIAKESLLALNLSTNETHIVTFDVDGGIDPTVELVVVDTRPEPSGNKSSDVSIEITGITVANGKVTLTVTIVNNEPGKTVEGWSWGVKSASTLDALDAASPGTLEPITDAAIAEPLTTELNATGDAQFYRGVLDDGE
jgi:hypothetical protein